MGLDFEAKNTLRSLGKKKKKSPTEIRGTVEVRREGQRTEMERSVGKIREILSIFITNSNDTNNGTLGERQISQLFPGSLGPSG